MSRYIDADKFKNHIENCICEAQNTNDNSEDFKIVLRALANQPIADVKEVVHGEWDNCLDYYRCSNCGELCTIKTSFCCRCGADMRAKQTDKEINNSHIKKAANIVKEIVQYANILHILENVH